MPDKLIVSVCRFKRSASAAFERGVMIGEDKSIIDLNGVPVSQVWTYDLLPEQGCFVIS